MFWISRFSTQKSGYVMIIVEICGGLGNQMFQYATAKAVACRTNLPLKLEISYFSQQNIRSYELDFFNISGVYATKKEVSLLKPNNWQILTKLNRKIKERRIPWYERKIIEEPYFTYNPDILKIKRSSFLVGYWQSEKYFKEISPIIRKEFTFKCEPNENSIQMIKKINETNSVSLHIRRGDYVTNPKHGVLGLDYYEKAIDFLKARVLNPQIFVFSDDILWAENNLKTSLRCNFISFNSSLKGSEDLRLMKECKYHIMANSSFSWWGAWLCEYPQKIVIAPKKWFNMLNIDIQDLIPKEWVRF